MKIKKIILILFLLALALRIIYVFTLDNRKISYWDDQGWDIARNLLEGKGYKMSWMKDQYSARPPVFPLFLTGIFFVFGQKLLIVRIFLAIFNSLICVVIFFLGKTMFNSKVGLTAMAISTVYPNLIYWSGYISQETLSTLFLALVILFILKIKNNLIFYSILSGISLGILIMTRSLAYGLIPLFFIWFAFTLRNVRHILTVGGIILFCVTLIVSPWVIRNYKVHRTLLLSSTEGGLTFYLSNNPEVLTKGEGATYIPDRLAKEIEDLSEIEADRHCYKKGLDFIRNYPIMYLRLVLERAIRFWRFYPHITGAEDSHRPIHIIIMLLTDAPVTLLGFWGLFLFFKKNRMQALLFIFIFIYFTAVSMLIASCIRYRTLIMPYLIILFSYLLYTWFTKIRSSHA